MKKMISNRRLRHLALIVGKTIDSFDDTEEGTLSIYFTDNSFIEFKVHVETVMGPFNIKVAKKGENE